MNKQKYPLVSLLVAVNNENGKIEQCINSLIGQDYPKELLEVFIADGMSTNGTLEVIRQFQANHDNIHLFSNPKQIVPTGLNILIPKAKGEILIRVDGHCVIAPDYVSNCVRHILEEGVDGAGGPMQSIGEGFVSEAIALAMSSKFGVGGSSFRTESGITKLADTIPFPAYTRAIIYKVGMYDEELVRNQDDEYNYRIRKVGGKILLAADVRSSYYSRGSLGKLWKQFFQYGYWKVRVLQKHPGQMCLRQFIPPLFVLGLTLFILVSLISSWGWILLVAIILSYLLSNLAASILASSNRGWNYLSLLPICFTILHFSYGLGFLVGLVKFWNRWGDKIGKVPAINAFSSTVQDQYSYIPEETLLQKGQSLAQRE